MSLPSNPPTTQIDQSTDDPKLARSQIKTAVDAITTLIAHLASSALTSGAAVLGVGEGLESESGNLRAKVAANGGVKRDTNGLGLDVGGLTAETAPDVADLVPAYDSSATAPRKFTLANLLKVVNGLTEDTTPDSAADFVLTYDASANGPKKVKLEKLPSGVASVDVQVFTSSGSWTKPTGARFVRIRCIAAGGGSNDPAAGAGGGAYAESTIAAASLGSSETVTVGTGGTITPTDGGDTSFGAHVVAKGGAKAGGGFGPQGAGGSASASTGQIKLDGRTGNVLWPGGAPPGLPMGAYGSGAVGATAGTAGLVIVESFV